MINLETCTKGQLKKSIGAMLRKARYSTYICLEDVYTKNPTIEYKADRDSKYNAFAEINAGFYGIDEMTNKPINAILQLEDDGEYLVSLDEFVDYLYKYIEENYR